MNGIDEARSLQRMAYKDFRALQGMMDGSVFADEIFGFHAQQAMEKLLKAWLAGTGSQFPLTHDLTRLLSLLERQGEDVEPFWGLAQYTVFAVQARYEEGLVEPDAPLDRASVIDETKALMDQVDRMLAG
jgi:hypothetical protein